MFVLDFTWWHGYLSLLGNITPTIEATVGTQVGQHRMSWRNQRYVCRLSAQILCRQHRPPIAKCTVPVIHQEECDLMTFMSRIDLFLSTFDPATVARAFICPIIASDCGIPHIKSHRITASLHPPTSQPRFQHFVAAIATFLPELHCHNNILSSTTEVPLIIDTVTSVCI